MKYYKLIIAPALAIMAGSLLQLGAQTVQNCQYCDRHGLLIEFNNPHNADYEEKMQEWRTCMQKQLGNYVSFEANDSEIIDASANCESLLPEEKWYCFPAIIAAYMGEQFTNQCFHMLSMQYFNPGRNDQPEYVFRGSYEANLQGGKIVEYAGDYKKPVISRMKIQLYYNGTSLEMVQEWSSENTVNDPKSLWSKLHMPRNLNPMLNEFEKRPVQCKVELPTLEELCKKGTGEIVLSDLRDARGNASKDFNRIVVSIFKGEILNGERSDFGPDYKVFTVGDGTIKVQYRPPADKDDGFEWLRVYNSCDILPLSKRAYSKTAIDKTIVDEKFPIACGYEGIISMSETMKAGEKESLLAALTPGGEYNISKNWSIEVLFKAAGSNSDYAYYDTYQAILRTFSDEKDQTMFHMEREGRIIDGKSVETAKARGLTLTTSECDLRLTINPVTGKYWIKGDINVEGIEIKGKDEMDIKVKPINEEINEDADGTTGIDEEVDISGTFEPAGDGSFPKKINGTKDYMQDVEEEFREFLEALGGKQSLIMTWDLKKN